MVVVCQLNLLILYLCVFSGVYFYSDTPEKYNKAESFGQSYFDSFFFTGKSNLHTRQDFSEKHIRFLCVGGTKDFNQARLSNHWI